MTWPWHDMTCMSWHDMSCHVMQWHGHVMSCHDHVMAMSMSCHDLDNQGIDPWTSRMLSGGDTTTPLAPAGSFKSDFQASNRCFHPNCWKFMIYRVPRSVHLRIDRNCLEVGNTPWIAFLEYIYLYIHDIQTDTEKQMYFTISNYIDFNLLYMNTMYFNYW